MYLKMGKIKFIEEYSQDSRQFEKLIKRQKIILFADVPCNVSGLCNLGPTTLRKPRDNILYTYIYYTYMLYIYSLSNQAMCTWAHNNNAYKVQIVIINLPVCSIS